MGISQLLWLFIVLFIVLAVCGVLVLSIWWLWRKITLPEGAPPPKWTDFSGLKVGSRAGIVVRLAVVGILGVFMAAPVDMIYDLVRERTSSYRDVVEEISGSWGGRQLLIGPILSVPYTIKYKVAETVPLTPGELKKRSASNGATHKIVSREVAERKTAVILPNDLRVQGDLEPELRRRGIYSVRVYTANLALSGAFKKPDFKAINENVAEVHWDKATVLVSLTDTKAFRDISPLKVGDREYNFVPGTGGSQVAPTGFSTEVNLADQAELAFSFNMSIGGSQSFCVAPTGVASVIELSSSWPHPSYSGDGLPSRRNEDNSQGFQAVWEVPNLVRNYPQFGDLSIFKNSRSSSGDSAKTMYLDEYVIGVELFEPVFHYSILTRAVKYAMMFIALTFLSVLIFEISGHRRGAPRLHLAQYGLIGLSLSLFYLVLLAASEHIPFIKAYLMASALNIAMIGGYVRAALKRNGEALVVSGILAALYSALFFILSMEEYALVSGTTLLVLAMLALMHATRNLGAQAARPTDACASSPALEDRRE